MKKRLICLLSCLSILFVSIPHLNINATNSIAAPDDFKSNLSSLIGHEASEGDIYDYSLLITTLIADGWNTVGLAGVLGNIVHESSAIYGIEGYNGKTCSTGEKPSQFQTGNSYEFTVSPSWTAGKDENGNKNGKYMGGEGHGIIQWSFGRATGLTTFCESNNFPYVTVTHYHTGWTTNPEADKKLDTYKIPNMAGQIAYICYECSSSYKGTKTEACACDNARAAAKSFHDTYEKSQGWNEVRADSAEIAVKVIEACTGIYGSASSSGSSTGYYNPDEYDDVREIANTLYSSNAWSEAQLSSFCTLAESTDIYDALVNPESTSTDLMSIDDLSSLSTWKTGVDDLNQQNSFVTVFRRVLAGFGIALILWAIFFYLAFWVDTMNNIVDFSLVHLLSFGMLTLSPEKETSTYGKNKEKGSKNTINHGDALRISLVATAFGILILTGLVYKFVFWLIINVNNLIKRIF